MALGCVEFAVPGKKLEDKLKTLEARGMWLELVNDGVNEKLVEEILTVLPSFNTQIMSVQAYLLHKLRMLNANRSDQKAAVRHVEETIELAARIGAQNVVVAIYGKPTVTNPKKKCLGMLKHFGRVGEELGVVTSVEALGRHRDTFLPSVGEICRLVREVGSSNVRAMADTEHIYANGENVAKTIEIHAEELAELHLRDTNSKPPSQGKIDFRPVLKVVRERFEGLVCLEYRPGLHPRTDFVGALKTAGAIVSAR